jgi:hypothetical protein
MKIKKLNKEGKVNIDIEQGFEIKVFNCIYAGVSRNSRTEAIAKYTAANKRV